MIQFSATFDLSNARALMYPEDVRDILHEISDRGTCYESSVWHVVMISSPEALSMQVAIDEKQLRQRARQHAIAQQSQTIGRFFAKLIPAYKRSQILQDKTEGYVSSERKKLERFMEKEFLFLGTLPCVEVEFTTHDGAAAVLTATKPNKNCAISENNYES